MLLLLLCVETGEIEGGQLFFWVAGLLWDGGLVLGPWHGGGGVVGFWGGGGGGGGGGRIVRSDELIMREGRVRCVGGGFLDGRMIDGKATDGLPWGPEW